MQSVKDELPIMVAVVQEYIYQQKGVHVRIVFNDPYKIRLHCQMLADAYSYVLQKNAEQVK